jgi:hypothetical protein
VIDTTSPTWAAVKQHCEAAIEAACQQLENDLDEKDTIKARARIKALREILKLTAPQPVITTTEISY